jgi:hypothetical protein
MTTEENKRVDIPAKWLFRGKIPRKDKEFLMRLVLSYLPHIQCGVTIEMIAAEVFGDINVDVVLRNRIKKLIGDMDMHFGLHLGEARTHNPLSKEYWISALSWQKALRLTSVILKEEE